jgi:hypothetical protein
MNLADRDLTVRNVRLGVETTRLIAVVRARVLSTRPCC